MIHDDDDDVVVYEGTLSSVFRKTQRHFIMRERHLKLTTENKEDMKVVVEENALPSEDDIVLKSKLTWLQPALDKKEEQFNATFTDDYPVLSMDDGKRTCPKIRDGFKCTKIKCRFYHPENDEIKKIVTDMKSLKRRVVKDVLKIIDSERPENVKREAVKNSKSRICKFGQKCKFKTTTCSYAHSEGEMVIQDCQFNTKCRFVKFSDGKYIHHNGGKCLFLHPNETKAMFLVRYNTSK